ncbi:MAG: hypothetical protein ACUVRS_10525 [Armatimonadota bacterium]
MSSDTSLALIAICQLVLTVAILAAAAGMIYVLISTKRTVSSKITHVLEELKPISEKLNSVAEQLKQTADKAADKIDSMLTATEDAVQSVVGTTESISKKIEESFSPRMATIATLITSIVKCLHICREICSHCECPESSHNSSEEK